MWLHFAASIDAHGESRHFRDDFYNVAAFLLLFVLFSFCEDATTGTTVIDVVSSPRAIEFSPPPSKFAVEASKL